MSVLLCQSIFRKLSWLHSSSSFLLGIPISKLLLKLHLLCGIRLFLNIVLNLLLLTVANLCMLRFFLVALVSFVSLELAILPVASAGPIAPWFALGPHDFVSLQLGLGPMPGEHGFVLFFALFSHLKHSVRLQRVHSDGLLVGLIGSRRKQDFLILVVCRH